MRPAPVKDNVHNSGGSASEQTLPLADNAMAKSSDNIVDGAPTTHINEMPCNKVTITSGPSSVTDG